MSSRQEEKERRKQERLAAEAAAASAAKRKRLIQIVGGVIVAAAAVVGVTLALASGGGGGDDGGDVDNAELKTIAQAAGCEYRSLPNEGRDHDPEKQFTAADYKSNPPTSGTHSPEPAQDGVYVAGNEPDIGKWVHTLEHGRVIFQYRPGVDKSVVDQLEKLFNEDVKGSGGAYHSVLMRSNSEMPFEAAAVAWRRFIGCEKLTPQAIDALRTFRTQLVDKAPELIP